jgi:hypothetical protein
MNKPSTINSPDDAIELALLFAGFDSANNIDDNISEKGFAKVITADNKNADFTKDMIDGRRAWKVIFTNVKLWTSSGLAKDSTLYKYMDVTVLLDSISGKLLEIRARNTKNSEYKKDRNTDILPYSIGTYDKYHGLPDIYPNVSFKNVLLKNRDLYLAKEIIGIYALLEWRKSDAKPVWIVTMLGIPPRELHFGTIIKCIKTIVNVIDGESHTFGIIQPDIEDTSGNK